MSGADTAGARLGILRASSLRHPVTLVSVALIAVLAIAMLSVAVANALVSDSKDCSIEVTARTGYASCLTNAGATVEYIGDQNTTFGSSGTGTFNSFVRVQGSPSEKGYNTDGTTEFDTKVGNWTHSIKVSDIPVVQVNATSYWEIFADVNDGNGGVGSTISLNDMQVWFTSNPNITGYGTTTFTSDATEQYAFSGNILINDVNQGSGRGDVRFRIPTANITIPSNCGYGDSTCATYFVLFNQWGIKGGDYVSDGGFEEWKVKQYPTIQIVKNTTGGDGTFGYTVTGPSAPVGPTITTSGGTGHTVVYIVDAGTFTINESTMPAGWQFTSATCSLNGGTATSYTQGANLVLGATDHLVCTFNNTAPGTIIVRKQTIGGTGTFTFTGTGGSTLPASITLSTAAQTTYVSQTFTNVTPGTYQVAETIPSGWDLTAADCGGTAAASNPAAFTLAAGATVTCSFTDTKRGTIIIQKQTIGGTGEFTFATTGDNGLPASVTLSTASQSTYVSQTFTNIIPGLTYSVGENGPPSGWDLTASSCTSGSPASFSVTPGGTVTCSFTDTLRGTIIVRKQTIGGTGQFTFTGTGGSNLPASITLSTAAQSTYVSQTFTNILPGTYQVGENGPPSGWDLTASSCTSGSPASFSVTPGGTVTCSFTDTLRGTIIVRKQTIGGTGQFVFSGTGGSNLPASITLSTAAQSTYVSQTFTNILPGTYQVGETVPAGWDLTAADCGGSVTASNPAAFTVAPGGSVTCSFTDTKESQIIVRKQTIGGTGQFVFTGTGGSNLPASITLSTAAQSTYVSQTFNNMIPGTYQVGENTPPSGWDLTSADCGGTPAASNPAAFTLAPGAVVTCSFTDTAHGTIIVRKQTIGGTGQFTFTGTGGSNLPASITLSTAAQSTYVSQTFTNVLPGTYQVAETVPSGWDLTAADCGGTPAASNPAAFTLVPGGTVTCSFTDTLRGTIIVRKQTIGGTGQFVFSGTGGSNLPASITLSTAAQSTYVSQTFTNILPGTYQVGETVPAGWDLTAADCGGTPAASNPAAFTVAPGGTVTCSFTDTLRGTIIVRKQTIGGTGTFTFTGTGGNGLPASVTLSTASQSTYVSQTFTNILPGTYAVAENGPPSGWDLTASSCTSGAPASFVVTPGGAVTCSFTDTKEGTIIVRKQTIGGTGQFTFTGTGGSNLPASITLSTAAMTTYVSQTFTNILPGTYQVGETVPTNWDLTSADCGGTPGTSNPAAFTVAPGATVTCSFTDTLRGTIIVRKLASGGDGTFSYPTTSSTDTPLPNPIVITTAGHTGTSTNHGLKPGTYTVTETFQSGWVFDGVSCSVTVAGAGGSVVPTASTTDPFVSLTLAAGATIQCDYDNSAPLTTRTQGFWATHLDLTLTVWNGGSIGGHTFAVTTDAQRTLCGHILTDEQLMGGFWASVSKTSDGAKRSSLSQAKMQLLQQLLAAILNNYAFGSAPTGITIDQAKDIFCNSTNVTTVKNAAAAMASFNESGDSGLFTPGVAANGKEAKDFAGGAGIAYWDYLN